MIWLTLRQFRAQLVLASAVIASLAIILAFTGPNLTHLFDASGIRTCQPSVNCTTLASRFLDNLPGIDPATYLLGTGLLLLVPVVIGVFWGAPLVTREFEARTYRLTWNQSVTRGRWLAAKVGVIGLAAALTSGVLSLMLTWWSSPIDRANSLNPRHGVNLVRVAPVLFDARGIAPIAYAAFGFVLGVTTGIVIRRTLPAMVATLGTLTVIQLAVPALIRRRLITPDRIIVALNPANIDGLRQAANNGMVVHAMPSYIPPGGWMLSSQVIDTTTSQPFRGAFTTSCLSGNFPACQTSISGLHLRQLITYQPASRFWVLQWEETVIIFVLTLLLAAVSSWWLRRLRIA
jgi:hypothetical protein